MLEIDDSKIFSAFFNMELAKEKMDTFRLKGYHYLQEIAKDFVKQLAENYKSPQVCLNMGWDCLDNDVWVELEGEDIPPIVLNHYRNIFADWGERFMNHECNEVFAFFGIPDGDS